MLDGLPALLVKRDLQLVSVEHVPLAHELQAAAPLTEHDIVMLDAVKVEAAEITAE
jgi:hypothetical protein